MMRPYFFTALFLICAGFTGVFGQDARKMEEVNALMQQQNYASGKSKLNKLIREYPEADSLYLKRGICNIETKEWQGAYDDLTKAIKLNPKMSAAYVNRARVFEATNDPHESINDLNMAVRYAVSDSEKVAAYLARSGARLAIHQWEGAIDDQKAVLEIDSTNLAALNDMGMALNDLGRQDEALACLMRTIAIDSTLYYAPMNIGFIMISKERYPEAVEWINKALAMKENDAYAYNNRGYAKLKMGLKEEALADINKSLSLNSNNAYAYRNRALVYIDLDQKDKACIDLKKSTELGFEEQYGTEVKELMKTHCADTK